MVAILKFKMAAIDGFLLFVYLTDKNIEIYTCCIWNKLYMCLWGCNILKNSDIFVKNGGHFEIQDGGQNNNVKIRKQLNL